MDKFSFSGPLSDCLSLSVFLSFFLSFFLFHFLFNAEGYSNESYHVLPAAAFVFDPDMVQRK